MVVVGSYRAVRPGPLQHPSSRKRRKMVDPRSAEHAMSAQMPAPKTFAPSREDVLSNLAFFFGDPAVPEKLRDYSEHHAMCASTPLNAHTPVHTTRRLTRVVCPRARRTYHFRECSTSSRPRTQPPCFPLSLLASRLRLCQQPTLTTARTPVSALLRRMRRQRARVRTAWHRADARSVRSQRSGRRSTT